MKTLPVAVLAGDGVGGEVMPACLEVLRATGARHGFQLLVREGQIGLTAYHATGHALPGVTMALCRGAPAVLVGPLAGPKHLDSPSSKQPRQALIKLRDWLGTFATVRPIRTYPALGRASGDVRTPFDLVMVYDHSSGLFYGQPRSLVRLPEGEVATNTMVYTSQEVCRVVNLACELARKRRGEVQSVDQAKLLETGQVWAHAVEAIAPGLRDVRLTRRDATHFFFELVRQPERYDVLVSEMSLGHLMAAVAQGLTGSFAVHPVAYLGGATSIFQPAHGSGPHIAGQGVADPLGMIRCGAFMLRWVFGEVTAADAIESAIEKVLAAGLRPAELCDGREPSLVPCSTRDLTAALIAALDVA
ncbi:MAG: isocitrate/isopropylmalate family dehydrogenase [Candidatus Sericytochromatia bacterium]|nr:isocitrate/isopropylmalate family dehydrogenase [Candidatus Sericytochromatia bacterium]